MLHVISLSIGRRFLHTRVHCDYTNDWKLYPQQTWNLALYLVKHLKKNRKTWLSYKIWNNCLVNWPNCDSSPNSSPLTRQICDNKFIKFWQNFEKVGIPLNDFKFLKTSKYKHLAVKIVCSCVCARACIYPKSFQ